MKSFQPFPNARLKPGGRITKQFLAHGITDFQSAAHHVHQLPYGINTDRTDIRLVLSEGQGTCSTKHALLSQLAREQGLEVSLMIGIFKMTASNTPGVGPVLAKYGLSYLPEAHCYLMFQGRRVDLTHSGNTLGEPIDRFLYEETITPDQIVGYKSDLHQQFLRSWLKEDGRPNNHNLEEIWKVREECIAVLNRQG